MNNFLLIWVPSLAAAMASLVGVGVAVSQLSSVLRWRQTATFWKEQLTVPTKAYDDEIARSLYREAASRVVALQAYPGWTLSGYLLVVVFWTTLSGLSGFLIAEQDSTFFWWLVVVTTFLGWGLIFWGLLEMSHVLDRRQIMAYLFLLEEELSSRRVESVLHARNFRYRPYPDYTGILLLSMGLFVFAVSLGVAVRSYKEGSQDTIFLLFFTVVIPIVGCLLIWYGYLLSRFYVSRHWIHPESPRDSLKPEMTVDSSVPE